MTIDMDVVTIARNFGLDPKLIQAVVNAEGNILKAVQCSLPTVQTRDEALRIVCRSAVHALGDYVQQQGVAGEFIAFWAKRWAPVGAENDPQGLNAHWPQNVCKGWGVASAHSRT